jgi:hypothetical protein
MRTITSICQEFFSTLVGLLLLIAINGCSKEPLADANPSFWVWKGTDMKWVAPGASIYLYQGDYGLHPGEQVFIKRGVNPSAGLANQTQVLLVRLYQRNAPETLATQLIYLVKQWEAKGAHIREIQLDHDCPSMQLVDYAKFIHKLNASLIEKNKPLSISVTGLATWLADNQSGLSELAEASAYIHFQLYSDFHPLPQLEQYLLRLKSYQFPYKLGVTTSPAFQYMEFVPNEKYQGTTIFLNK